MTSRILNRLRILHARLEAQLVVERRAGVPDATRISRLKKFKLAVKDRLNDLQPLGGRA